MRPEDSEHEGTFAQLSFTQLLVRALDKRYNGTLFVEPPFDMLQIMQIDRGLISRVLVSDDYGRLGELLVEAGVVMESELALALTSDDLLGQTLISQEVVDDRTLKRALVLQVLKRLVRIFDFPVETEWSFIGDFEAFEDMPEGTRMDTLRVLWAGISTHGEMPDVMAATLERIGSSSFELRPDVTLSRFGFSGDAARLVGVINAGRTTMRDLLAQEIAPPEVVRSIAYLLAITRHLNLSPLGDSSEEAEPLSTAALSGVDPAPSSPRSSSEDDDGEGGKRPRRVARIQLHRITYRGAAPDPAGTGEQQSRPSSEGSTSQGGDVTARRKEVAPVADEIKSRLAGLDQEAPFSLLGMEPAALEGKEESEVTEILWNAYEAAGCWHPDHCPESRPDLREGMKKLYDAISDALVVLADPDTRAKAVAQVAEQRELSSTDSVSSGLRPIEPSDGKPTAGLNATTPSGGAVQDGATPGDGDETPDRIEPTWSPEQLHERALVALSEERPSEAFELSQQACDAEPDNPDYMATSLWIQAKLPRPDLKVLTLDLDDLLRTHLDHVATRYYRGMLRRRLGYDSAAKQDFERVLDLDPVHAGAKAQLVELGKGAGRRR